MDHIRSFRLTALWRALLCLAFISAAGCAPAQITISPDATQPPAEYTPPAEPTPMVDTPTPTPTPAPALPTESTSVLPPLNDQTSLVALFPALSDDFVKQISGQLEQFAQVHPNIQLSYNFEPPAGFPTKLQSLLAAGTPPDLTALDYNMLAGMVQSGASAKFDQYPSTYWNIFLEDAAAGDRFGNDFYGVPWFRDACSPAYTSLALFTSDPLRAHAAHLLAEYLTGYGLQKDNLFNLNMFPTINDLYQAGVLSCPAQKTLRLPPSALEAVVNSSQVDADSFSTLEQKFNPSSATALVPQMVSQSSDFLSLARLTPAQAFGQHYKDFLVFGILQLDDPAVSGSLGLSPGRYMLVCSPNPDAPDCSFVDTQGNFTKFDPQAYQKMGASVSEPGVFIETGSIEACFYLDGLRLCITLFANR